jgi:Tol biopolymer transport system component
VTASEPDPLGQWLAFATSEDPRLRTPRTARRAIVPQLRVTVYDVDLQTVALQCVEMHEETGGVPAWSLDGNRVLFVGEWHAFVVDMPSRTVLRIRRPDGAPLAKDPRLKQDVVHAALSHNGRTIALVLAEDEGRVWLAPVEFPEKAPTTTSTTNP